MTNSPGDGPPQDPGGQPQEPPREQPGYWPGQGQDPPPYGQPQYGQPQYGQPPYGQPPYGPPGYGPQFAYAPDHPKSTTALVLGILGVVLCQFIAPFAWLIGKRTVDEIDASRGGLGGRGSAQAGYVLGIVGTVLLGLGVLYFVFLFGVLVIGVASSSSP
jgi:hypothetical protein